MTPFKFRFASTSRGSLNEFPHNGHLWTPGQRAAKLSMDANAAWALGVLVQPKVTADLIETIDGLCPVPQETRPLEVITYNHKEILKVWSDCLTTLPRNPLCLMAGNPWLPHPMALTENQLSCQILPGSLRVCTVWLESSQRSGYISGKFLDPGNGPSETITRINPYFPPK